MITALKVSGNKLIDTSGKTIVLRGTNNIGAFYSCLTNQFPVDPVFGGVPFSLASLQIMQKWGINCVRVLINSGCWLNCCVSPFTSGITYQNAILAYIDNINLAGMYCIVCLVGTAIGTEEMFDSNV